MNEAITLAASNVLRLQGDLWMQAILRLAIDVATHRANGGVVIIEVADIEQAAAAAADLMR